MKIIKIQLTAEQRAQLKPLLDQGIKDNDAGVGPGMIVGQFFAYEAGVSYVPAPFAQKFREIMVAYQKTGKGD